MTLQELALAMGDERFAPLRYQLGLGLRLVSPEAFTKAALKLLKKNRKNFGTIFSCGDICQGPPPHPKPKRRKR